MSSYFNFVALVEAYQKLHNIENVTWEGENSFALSNESFEINIGFDEASQTLTLVSYIGFININNKEQVYAKLLLDNFACRSNGASFWSLYAQDEAALTTKKCVQDADQHQLSEWIVQLCMDTEKARNILNSINEQNEMLEQQNFNKSNSFNQFITP